MPLPATELDEVFEAMNSGKILELKKEDIA